MVREGSVVQGGLPLVVERVEPHLLLEENIHHHVLAVVAGHMEGGAAIGIHSIRLVGLRARGKEHFIITYFTITACTQALKYIPINAHL